MAMRFDGKVVVVTGAGGGLGKCYALAFAQRGAKVVVNDLGGSDKGMGSSSKAADEVVAEIKAKGGEAAADYHSVEDGDKIVESAIAAFGRIDILVNNAGILRDTSVARMTDKDWDLITAVHLKGVYKTTKAAWPHMLESKFGRIVNVSSPAGLYGNFGQANYSTAKSGILGFTKSCAVEGQKKNVLSNAICPIAASRMTEKIMPAEVLQTLTPEAIVPLVLAMCHEGSAINGEVIECGGGWFAKVQLVRAEGAFVAPQDGGAWSPEEVLKSWDKITDFEKFTVPKSMQDSVEAMMKAAKRSKL